MRTPIPWLVHRLLLYKAERKPFSTLSFLAVLERKQRKSHLSAAFHGLLTLFSHEILCTTFVSPPPPPLSPCFLESSLCKTMDRPDNNGQLLSACPAVLQDSLQETKTGVLTLFSITGLYSQRARWHGTGAKNNNNK